MTIGKLNYKTLRDLLARELVADEDPGTAELIKSLRHAKRAKVLARAELISICRW